MDILNESTRGWWRRHMTPAQGFRSYFAESVQFTALELVYAVIVSGFGASYSCLHLKRGLDPILGQPLRMHGVAEKSRLARVEAE